MSRSLWIPVLLVALCATMVGCASQQRQPADTSGLEQRISGLEADLADRDRSIGELRTKLTELERRIANMRPSVTTVGPGNVTAIIEGPTEGFPGDAFPWTITVTNRANQTASDIEIRAQIDTGLEVSENGGGEWIGANRMLRWHIPTLPAGEATRITFTTTATAVGDFQNCVDVVARLANCAQVRVLQPSLECQVSAGEVQANGVAFAVTVSATNTGSGTARNVVGTLTLSGNLRGPASVTFGDIPGGQRVERRIDVTPTADGPFNVDMIVRGQPGNIETQCGVRGDVVSPNLEIEKVGPKVRYMNQEIAFQITVRSTGTTVARQTILTDPIPPTMQFGRAGQGGQLVGNAVQWNLGDLQPGDSRTVDLVLVATQEGDINNCANVQAVGVPRKEACWPVRVLYVAAMHIDCYDTEDPIEIGGSTVYIIDIKNEGRKDTTNVVLRVDLPREGDFVDAQSASSRGTYDQNNHQVVFSSIPVMRPGETATFRLTVKFHTAGSAVASGIMTFDEFSKPIRSEEGTNIYE